MPDPHAIEQQKNAYARSLDEQLQQAIALVKVIRLFKVSSLNLMSRIQHCMILNRHFFPLSTTFSLSHCEPRLFHGVTFAGHQDD